MADQTIQYTEEMVGSGHPTKSDTLNRLALVEHNTDGTHKTDAIAEKTPGHGVTVDGVTLKDGGALTIIGGTNNFNVTNGTASLDLAAGATADINANITVESASAINQDLTSDASPTFVTVKLTGLTDGYVPKHTADATGLENSNLYSDGNNIGLGQTSFGTSAAKVFGVGSGTAPTTSPADAAQVWVQDNTGQGASGLAQLYARDEFGVSGPVMHALDQRECQNGFEIIAYS